MLILYVSTDLDSLLCAFSVLINIEQQNIEKISIACFGKIGLWSAYIGRATTFRALTSAIPLLLDAGALSCWMSPLARIAPT